MHRFSTPHAGTKPENHRRAGVLGFVFALLIATGCGFLGGYFGANSRTQVSSISDQQQIISSEGQLISRIADTVGDSVVSVDVTSQTSQPRSLYEYYYGGGSSRTQASAGTGIILSSDGVIITNRHVVPEGTSNVSVTLEDGTTFDNVKVIARASESDNLDIAFLKIDNLNGKKLTPASLGDSTKTKVGDRVVAIGNALGQFQNTVTSGIISGYGRSIQAGSASEGTESLQDLFQTDAAINEGNSGGPLVNASGQVIGINTAVASDSQNIGFAIPIADVQNLIKQVLDTGSFQRPYLGVRYIPLSSTSASQFGVSETSGAYLPRDDQAGNNPAVIAGSPASIAGLQGGDIIKSLNGRTITNSLSLSTLLNQQNVGDEVTLSVLRDGKTIEIKATLEAAPQSQ